MARAGPAAEQRHQPLDGPAVDHQAEPGGGDAEAGVRRGHPQVARRRQLGAGAEGGALDGGDGDGRQLGRARSARPRRAAKKPSLSTPVEVGAGAERAARRR